MFNKTFKLLSILVDYILTSESHRKDLAKRTNVFIRIIGRSFAPKQSCRNETIMRLLRLFHSLAMTNQVLKIGMSYKISNKISIIKLIRERQS
jgi:hypothetical protein